MIKRKLTRAMWFDEERAEAGEIVHLNVDISGMFCLTTERIGPLYVNIGYISEIFLHSVDASESKGE